MQLRGNGYNEILRVAATGTKVTQMTTDTTISTRTVHIGNVIRNAVVFDPKQPKDRVMNAEALPETVTRLFTLLHERKIDYVLVGGIALLQYIEGRNTEDIDLIMALSALRQLREVQITSQDRDFAHGAFGDLKLDILLTRNRLFDKVRRQYTTVQHFVEQDIPCATVEGLLLLKLYALPSLYRQGDFTRVSIYENDLATLIYHYQPSLEPLFRELGQHVSNSDLTAIRDVVDTIERRIERFDKGLGNS
jgi:hypothetical protein